MPREQLIGMDVIDRFVSPEDMHQVRQNINSNVEGVYEIKIRSATGRLFPAELRTRPGELAGQACRWSA